MGQMPFVTFPLLGELSSHVRANPLTPPSPTDATAFAADVDRPPLDSSSRNKSKVGALKSIGAIRNDFLVSKIMHLPLFATAGETFITPIRRHVSMR
jgi:hypothetical protein